MGAAASAVGGKDVLSAAKDVAPASFNRSRRLAESMDMALSRCGPVGTGRLRHSMAPSR
jgi:hypothetical protein